MALYTKLEPLQRVFGWKPLQRLFALNPVSSHLKKSVRFGFNHVRNTVCSNHICQISVIYCQRFENEKISSQTVGSCKNCYQNGDRVSKNCKGCHICRMRLNCVCWNMKNMGLCLYKKNKIEKITKADNYQFGGLKLVQKSVLMIFEWFVSWNWNNLTRAR